MISSLFKSNKQRKLKSKLKKGDLVYVYKDTDIFSEGVYKVFKEAGNSNMLGIYVPIGNINVPDFIPLNDIRVIDEEFINKYPEKVI